MSLIITNARSLQPKMSCFIDYMNDLQPTLSIITEPWLYESELYNKIKDDLKEGDGYDIISTFRPLKRDGS